MNGKPVKYSVAAVVRRRGDPRFLAVLRPDDPSDPLAGLWGLPALTLAPEELPEEGVRRLGREKLGAVIEPVGLLGIDHDEREEYRIILMDFEALLLEGDVSLQPADTATTQYVALEWTDDPELLRPAAKLGSLCCRILLSHAAQ